MVVEPICIYLIRFFIMNIEIFIIEDDFVFARVLSEKLDDVKQQFQKEGVTITCHTFYSAREASYELDKKPDIILLDYFIMNDDLEPETATEFLKTIKKYDPRLDVLIVSGQESPAISRELLAHGASAYISKDPEEILHLSQKITELIQKRLK